MRLREKTTGAMPDIALKKQFNNLYRSGYTSVYYKTTTTDSKFKGQKNRIK